MTEAVTELPTFPMDRGCPFDPPPEYTQLRHEQPISKVRVPGGKTAWFVARHDHARQLLADPRLSSNRVHPNFPGRREVTPETRKNALRFSDSLIGLDLPEHTAPRRMVIPEFTVPRVQQLRPRIQQIVDEAIDQMLTLGPPTNPSVDLVAELSLPVPSMVICELLGVPYADRETFHSRTKVLINMNSTVEQSKKASDELAAYLDRLVTAKEAKPGDDMLGRLIVANKEKGVFDHDKLVGLATLLLIAGHETTANMISLGTVALLRAPEQLAEIKNDPSLTSRAVEEILRYFTIVDTIGRVAKEDIDIDGQTIRAGDGVLIAAGSANRDEAAFPHADTIDIHRGARQHVSFGFGVHQCLGQNLARTELEIVFNTLFARIPGLALAANEDELPFKTDMFLYGLHRLPVTW